MKILVLVRPDRNGELSPFEMSAYEMALSVPGSEVTLLSMASMKMRDTLLSLTRLGAKKVIMLSDMAFAGSDTLATSYILSKAIARIPADFILCGRKTMEGDTAQVPPMIAEYCGLPFITGAMAAEINGTGLVLRLRDADRLISGKAVISVEKNLKLRKPRITSVLGEIEIWDADAVGADKSRIGLGGSPTKVLRSFENESGKRKCKFLPNSEFKNTLRFCLENSAAKQVFGKSTSEKKLPNVVALGDAAADFGKICSDSIRVLPEDSRVDDIISIIEAEHPNAVLFPSNERGKELAARVAVRKGLGLCADCTSLETDGSELFMIRPALSGTVIAKIRSSVSPALCTVRTKSESECSLVVAAGFGAKDSVDSLARFAKANGGELAASRKLVDNGFLPYDLQVGLTGKTVAPSVYLAVGISGALHHIVGMDRSSFVIAVNPDKSAPIFQYADFGFIADSDLPFS